MKQSKQGEFGSGDLAKVTEELESAREAAGYNVWGQPMKEATRGH
jgi:hypothetical protein